MPSVATAIDIARLYEELRDCVRANDQEGVKRVFAELVAARRPVAEILAEVKSLTKEREAAEAEKAEAEETAKNSFTREWPVATASAQIRPSPPAPAYRRCRGASCRRSLFTTHPIFVAAPRHCGDAGCCRAAIERTRDAEGVGAAAQPSTA